MSSKFVQEVYPVSFLRMTGSKGIGTPFSPKSERRIVLIFLLALGTVTFLPFLMKNYILLNWICIGRLIVKPNIRKLFDRYIFFLTLQTLQYSGAKKVLWSVTIDNKWRCNYKELFSLERILNFVQVCLYPSICFLNLHRLSPLNNCWSCNFYFVINLDHS